jgi:hypothetical protein
MGGLRGVFLLEEWYLGVGRADVADFAHLLDFALDFVGQGDWGEDGEGTRLQAHCESC